MIFISELLVLYTYTFKGVHYIVLMTAVLSKHKIEIAALLTYSFQILSNW